jgi:hexosaminidase
MIKLPINLRPLFLTISFLFIFSSFTMVLADDYNIIPYPQHLIPQSGEFTFGENTAIYCVDKNVEIQKLAQQFSDQLALVSGLKFVVTVGTPADTTNAVIFQYNNAQGANSEAYTLNVSTKTIRITAATANGIFYGLQSIYQLLPADIYGKKKALAQKWSVPAVQITDVPRFGYRGLHLDVCRHFFPVEFIKKYIDAMAIHKFNTFHWHLTDDQGWRIEIKKYPLLTKVGSRRVETLVGYYYENYPQRFDDDAYGGFYTQDEAREIVKYAKDRFITVIPEIEMPGHAMAAIASYPYLSCNQTPIKVATKWGVFKDVYCTRDTTFAFLEDVLTEIMAIFPSNYIHNGGDECPKERWKACPDCQARIKTLNLKDENALQSYFIQRIEKFLNAHDRRIIGWDEILDGGLAPNATVMSWRGTQGGIAAAKSGHKVIMTPNAFCYFDHYQADPTTEPTTIGGFLPLKTVYGYNPVPSELSVDESKFVLGAQANVWTEYMKDSESVEYMAFPRVSAMAEVVWTDTLTKNWDRFRSGMAKEFNRYAAMDIQPSKVFNDMQSQSSISKDRKLLISLNTDNPNTEIRYTLDGSTPTAVSKLYKDSIKLMATTTVKAIALENGKVIGKEFLKIFVVSKVTGLSYIQNPTNTWYRGDNTYSLTDGTLGNTKSYAQWVAIGASKDGEFIIDLKSNQSVSRMSVGLLNLPAMCGMYPSEIMFYTSMDGIQYNQVASETIKQRTAGGWEIYRPELLFPPTNARFVKLVLLSAGSCSNVEAGGNSMMFLDEIGVW